MMAWDDDGVEEVEDDIGRGYGGHAGYDNYDDEYVSRDEYEQPADPYGQDNASEIIGNDHEEETLRRIPNNDEDDFDEPQDDDTWHRDTTPSHKWAPPSLAQSAAPSESQQALTKQEAAMFDQYLRNALKLHVVASAEQSKRAELLALSEEDVAASLASLHAEELVGPERPWERRPGDTTVSALVRVVEAHTLEVNRSEWLEERLVGVASRLGFAGGDADTLRRIAQAVPIPDLPDSGDVDAGASGTNEDLESASAAESAQEEAMLRERMLKNPLLRLQPDGKLADDDNNASTDVPGTPAAVKTRGAKKKKAPLIQEPADAPQEPASAIDDAGLENPGVDNTSAEVVVTPSFAEFFAALLPPEHFLAPAAISVDVAPHICDMESAARGLVESEEDTHHLLDDAEVLLTTECDEAFEDVLQNWTVAGRPAPVPQHLHDERSAVGSDVLALRDANAAADQQLLELREALTKRQESFDANVATRRDNAIVLDAEDMREALRQCRAIEAEIVSLRDAAAVNATVASTVQHHVRHLTEHMTENDDVIHALLHQIESLEAVGRTSGLWGLSHRGGSSLEAQYHIRRHADPTHVVPSATPRRDTLLQTPLQSPVGPGASPASSRLDSNTAAYRFLDETVFMRSIDRAHRTHQR